MNDICKFSGCGKNNRGFMRGLRTRNGTSGFCESHIKQEQRTGAMTTIRTYPHKFCTVKDCKNPSRIKSTGLCNSHNLSHHYDVLVSKEENQCELCPLKHYAKGLCMYHWRANRACAKLAEVIANAMV